jgi:hypothetical protein
MRTMSSVLSVWAVRGAADVLTGWFSHRAGKNDLV